MKKNLRKIPKIISLKIAKIREESISLIASKRIQKKEIEDGLWNHLGIHMENGKLKYFDTKLPDSNSGKYSKRNIEGWEIIRKDLPKETHYNSVIAPNWGDSYKGTHYVDLPYEMYPREFVAAKEKTISIRCVNQDAQTGPYLFSFILQSVLKKNDKHFNEELFFDLNLMQENVGTCDVEKSTMTHEAYVKTLFVEWEILPPGTKEEVLSRMFRNYYPTKEEKDTASDRYDFFKKLGAKSLVYGTSGFQRYFGALIRDDLVVFENIKYGNAVYVLFDNWQVLSKKNRLDIMSGKYGDKYKRVVHLGDWKSKITKIISEAKKH
jgi:hypothetical protein